ncbi:MAG: ABC transporter ATP-binding protein [Trueperaceae bacterium]|nr:ABC transporter ATP-binding protein [Trueperaceae bacterium]
MREAAEAPAMPVTDLPRAATATEPLLRVEGLKKYFPIEKGFLRRRTGVIKAVDGVSLEVMPGETVGLVGESGSGKTTLGRCVMRGLRATDGSIEFKVDGRSVDMNTLTGRALQPVRKHIQMVFQDPYTSLDPRMTVLEIVGEPLVYGLNAKRAQVEKRVKELMDVVGLSTRHINRYPHAFSGGQRQRIGIARAIATNPSLIVADEPVSALDVSIQAQILNLLVELQERLGLAYLFVAHDLSVVEHISDRVAVMYVGQLVEQAKTEDLFSAPQHPYTEALLSAVPRPDPHRKMDRIVLRGDVANPADPPSGCYFHPRCPYARDICSVEKPALREIKPGHHAACHFSETLDLQGVS